MPQLMILATAVAPIQGSRSFSKYSSRPQWNIAAPEVDAVGKKCGFEFSGESPIYGVRYGEEWKRRKNLKSVGDDAETDLYQAAEIWRSRSGITLAAIWSISADTVDEDEMIACIASNGKLLEFVSTHTRTRPDSGDLEWRFNRQAEYGDGHQLSDASAFISYEGKPVVTPKLERGELGSLTKPVDPSEITRIVREVEAEIRKDHATQE